MIRLRRAIKAAITEWREPRGLRNAKLVISNDGHLVGVVFPPTVTVHERNNVRRELCDALVAGGYWQKITDHWRHLKRGTEYAVIGTASVQAEQPIAEGALVVVYRSLSDGSLWARPESEFHDGRFEALPK